MMKRRNPINSNDCYIRSTDLQTFCTGKTNTSKLTSAMTMTGTNESGTKTAARKYKDYKAQEEYIYLTAGHTYKIYGDIETVTNNSSISFSCQ